MMARTDRFQFLAKLFRPDRIERKRKRPTREYKSWREPCWYAYSSNTLNIADRIFAFSRSEARAMIKKRHGLKTTAGFKLSPA
jgi:hypothetical protein